MTDWLHSLSVLSYNSWGLLEPNRRTKFSNCMSSKNYYIFCISKTWFTPDIQNEPTFFPKYQIYRSNHKREPSQKLKHGVVMRAIHLRVHHTVITTKYNNTGHCVVLPIRDTNSISLCCTYNAHLSSFHQGESSQFLSLLQEIESLKLCYSFTNPVITADICSSNSNGKNMSSNNVYKNTKFD